MVWDPVLGVQVFIDFFSISIVMVISSIGLFPGLGIIIIFAIFSDLGQYSIRSMALNI